MTDDSGKFRFDGLWGGICTIQIPMSAGWRQTDPPLLQPYNIHLGDEQNLSGFNFGVTNDSTFNVAFRTFIPESLTSNIYDNRGRACMPMPQKYFESDQTYKLVVPTGGLNNFHVQFKTTMRPESLSATRFLPPTYVNARYKWRFELKGNGTLSAGDTITIFARWKTPKWIFVSKYWWGDTTSDTAKGQNINKSAMVPTMSARSHQCQTW